ncbi:hypothetical protein HY636_03150 [Candidatus Woesearchaeota archaeon]|nr:hypothetical protein [Candidatus Woesearchaeota archaeon]
MANYTIDTNALSAYYYNVISDWCNTVKQGNPIRIGISALTEKEWRIALSYQGDAIPEPTALKETHNERKRILLGGLHQKLSVLNHNDLEQILEKVRNPLLDAATMWLAAHNEIENVTREQFVQGFGFETEEGTPSGGRVTGYLMPIVLLELAIQQPEIISKLEEDSIYFLHRLFDKKAKATIGDTESEIAESLPLLYSEELLKVMPRIDEFIQKISYSEIALSNGVYTKKGITGEEQIHTLGKNLGKYHLSKDNNYCFVQTSSSVKRGEIVVDILDSLYGQSDMKKEIYTTLANVLVLTCKGFMEKRGSITSLKNRSSFFSIGLSLYQLLIYSIRNYAINQMLSIWKNSKGEFKSPETPLSRLMFLSATTQQDGRLSITDNMMRHSSTSYYTHNSFFLDTTAYLPLCVCVLNENYKIAMEINAERSARAQSETQSTQ